LNHPQTNRNVGKSIDAPDVENTTGASVCGHFTLRERLSVPLEIAVKRR
jgi:hypothetical protein